MIDVSTTWAGHLQSQVNSRRQTNHYNFHALTTNYITTKLTNPNEDQRHKCHHLTMTLHLTLKMTTAQVVKTSVTNNSLSKDYLHPDDRAKQITDTPGFKPFTKVQQQNVVIGWVNVRNQSFHFLFFAFEGWFPKHVTVFRRILRWSIWLAVFRRILEFLIVPYARSTALFQHFTNLITRVFEFIYFRTFQNISCVLSFCSPERQHLKVHVDYLLLRWKT